MSRQYSVVDLMRFHFFVLQHPELKSVEVIHLYNETFPELTEYQRLMNIKKQFGNHQKETVNDRL